MDRGCGLMGFVFYFVFVGWIVVVIWVARFFFFLIFFLLMGLVVDRGWVHGG